MSRLNTLFEHAKEVKKHGTLGRGYIPKDLYERHILSNCDNWGIDQTYLIRAMIELIIDGGLNKCLD